MKIGTVCYATSRGLGHLAKDFIDHGVINEICIVEHPGVPTNHNWYPNAPKTQLKSLNKSVLRDFARGFDALVFFETPFDWSLLSYCRDNHIKTAIVTMYECSNPNSPQPDLYLCPSLLDMQYFPAEKSVFLPLPVDLNKTPWKLRERAELFIHNGGYLGMQGREGTTLLIDAMEHVKSPIDLTIRCQENVDEAHIHKAQADERISYRPETVPYEELYSTGDVSVGAQKWNGCSLPLQEAFASGLLVMNSNRFPMNTWLPVDPLIPVAEFRQGYAIRGHNRIELAIVDPKDIAKTIDAWYGRDITAYSLAGKKWAEENSWDILKPKYLSTLARLCNIN